MAAIGLRQAAHEQHSFAQQCGTWGAAYADQHRRILAGTAQAKYLVTQTESGLADNLVFISGMLYVAVLTGRAFQLAEEDLPYSLVYEQRFIDWRDTPKGESLSSSQFHLGTSGALPLHEHAFRLIHNGSLNDLSPEADVLYATGNTGISAVLFDNPHYQKQLHSMGLRPEAAFHCAMNYLFQPSVAVRTHFEREFDIMSSDRFKVAIQLRLGDYFTAGSADLPARFAGVKLAEPELGSLRHFFECAEQLEETFNVENQEAIWFLISDSLEVRQLASAAYPKKVVTHVVQPGHVAATEGHAQVSAMIQAAGEHWLLGMTDYQVVSAIGSFGKTGSLRNPSWHTMYRLPVNHVYKPGEVVCDGLSTRALDYGEISQWAPFV